MYKLKNIQLEYEVIRSKSLADDVASTYSYGKEFAYELVMLEKIGTINRGTDGRLNLRVNPQRRSLKASSCYSSCPTLQALEALNNTLIQTLPKKVSLSTVPQTGFTMRASLASTCGVRQAGSLGQKVVADPT